MRDDFRLMNDSQNKKMYVINLSGQPPARGLWYGIETFQSKDESMAGGSPDINLKSKKRIYNLSPTYHHR